MIAGLPLDFTAPALLTALAALPVLWWLLRLLPPRPKKIAFPPTRILFDIEPKEETPARTPWWLTALRLLLAALIILAAAGPIWNPAPAGMRASGPIAILLDNGWASAASWEQRRRAATEIITRAENERRAIALIPSAAPPKDISLMRPGEARDALRLIVPAPHTPSRIDALAPLAQFLRQHADTSVIWLSDSTDIGNGGEFIRQLREVAGDRLTIVSGGIVAPRALVAPENAASGLTVKVLRADTTAPDGLLQARDLRGLLLGEAPFTFKAGELETEASFDLPVEIRNDIARIEIANERSAGAVQLLDKRWRRRAVGIVSGGTVDTRQPLLSASYYLTRALSPFAGIRTAENAAPSEAITGFIEQRLPVMVLSDVGTIAPAARERLEKWIDDGGLLIRFAGPRLAAAEDDDLVPVRLRRGGRVLGGSLSWEQPQHLGAFPRESPFHDLAVPADVTVSRQVLAEPDAQLADRTWAALTDGTPLVTAIKRGRGMLVLFHVAADTRWSNLPISGTFVEMLRRTIALAGTSSEVTAPASPAPQAAPTLAPARLLDGFGTFVAPGPTARPIPAEFNEHASFDHPPGFYGPPESAVAVNTLSPAERLKPLDFGALKLEPYRQTGAIDLRAAMLAGVMILLLADGLIVLWLSGGLNRLNWRRAGTAALVLFALFAFTADRALAQTNTAPQGKLTAADEFALRATLKTRLAYVVTGNREVDDISRAGLQGLSLFLAQRTALEPGDPIGVDPARDELAFFPILYWPVTADATKPPAATLAKIDAYMKQGGSILFDTRDAFSSLGREGAASPALVKLREILSSLDIPELEPVPQDHVLTKSFYLLRDFPGRFATGKLWVEALPDPTAESESRPARAGDGVSPILITSNDLAGAWAINPDGQPLLPITQNEPRQREFAYRAGANIVMYVLTGNYKADQVHAPALIERLGQ